jgi:ubiquinone/menaquinone biosynthesis C-methylase UbiE
MSIDANNEYTAMQKGFYNELASKWDTMNRDHVVGSFDAHNNWHDYECMFVNIPDQDKKKVLDFGCGPGRNLVKYSKRFARIDGVDIDETNLKNAKTWITHSGLNVSDHTLYLCNGCDLKDIPSDTYDIVMSTIAMQHICVYEIRFNYFKEFLRVLKSGGVVTIQMAYGPPKFSGYYENNWDAISTNGACDVVVTDPNDLKKDLEKIGFVDYLYEVKGSGPGDHNHPNWIFFRATKP